MTLITGTNAGTYKKIAEWALGDDTGISSKFFAACVLRIPEVADYGHPIDPDDFGRLYRLVRILSVGEGTVGFVKAAEKSKEWNTIGMNWLTLCNLFEKEVGTKKMGSAPKLYKFMKELGL